MLSNNKLYFINVQFKKIYVSKLYQIIVHLNFQNLHNLMKIATNFFVDNDFKVSKTRWEAFMFLTQQR